MMSRSGSSSPEHYGCNHEPYLDFLKRHRDADDPRCVVCHVNLVQEASAKEMIGPPFNLCRFRISRNTLELEEILVQFDEDEVPQHYVEFRRDVISRRLTNPVQKIVRDLNMAIYDHSTSVMLNPVTSPTLDDDPVYQADNPVAPSGTASGKYKFCCLLTSEFKNY